MRLAALRLLCFSLLCASRVFCVLRVNQLIEATQISIGGAFFRYERHALLIELPEKFVPRNFLQLFVTRIRRAWKFEAENAGFAILVGALCFARNRAAL